MTWTVTAYRLLAWSSIVLIAVLSLLPAEEMIRTTLGGHIEHMLAYAAAAFITALAYSRRRLGQIVFALICYAAILEYLQRFSPGRHPAIADWASSSAGVLVGGGFFSLWRRKPLEVGRR
jgi:VanZ family protein